MDRGALPLGPGHGAGGGQTSLLQASWLSLVQQANLPGPPLPPSPSLYPTPTPRGTLLERGEGPTRVGWGCLGPPHPSHLTVKGNR